MIFFSHGDKGGVGKSVISCLAVEAATRLRIQFLVIEGDKTTSDVGRRYKREDEEILGIDLNRSGDSESAILDLGNALEQIEPSQLVVVNLPAGAGATLDRHADVIAGIAAEVGHELVVGYSLGPSDLAAAALAGSIKSGLISVASRARIFLPLFLAREGRFAWLSHPSRPNFIARFGDGSVEPISVINPLDLREKIHTTKRGLGSLAYEIGGGLTTSERHVFKGWLESSVPAVLPLIEPVAPPARGRQ